MKKTILLIIFIHTMICQADDNTWIWEDEKQQAIANLKKTNQEIADAKATLQKLKDETHELEKIKANILKEVTKKPLVDSNQYNLNINTVPKNAEYTLKDSKGRNVDYTWGMQLAKGKYSLKVWKKGYASKNIPITLDENKSINVELTKICKLRINPSVSGATIKFTNINYTRYLNKRYVKDMTLTCNQSYFLKVSKPGYRTEKISTLMRKSQTNIPVRLQRQVIRPRYCKLTILPNTPGAIVQITNIREQYKNGIKLPCGRDYQIKVKKGRCIRRFSTHLVKKHETIPVDVCR